ncbi:LCP family protein [Alkalihalophilus lindianensis]|uniref:Polyisoprenyl-teichoic acid--peptidoglycan teichoic acid transferase TagU n=1 Tax=Alkalihalophilus lindianensis TaxID=1630542 RepID=A0ABU3XAI9_9BACI|nr:LCP family protein [Alkalihalophilus lindianensis]MDV2684419.1 LCP family protein [Alkalihalophilus lindianensis]
MKKSLKIIGIILGILFLSVVGYGAYLYFSVTSTANEIHEPLERDADKSDKRTEKVNVDNQDPLSILIAGVDSSGEAHSGRSDTIIVLTVNPKEESIKMLSIPRDTRTELIGRGTTEKINHAYAWGGIKMTVDTVENFLDVPIDHYVSVNMEGFTSIVDALGGVTVDNEFAFSQSGHQFNEGENVLNGEQALAYSRMRKADSRGDFGRNDRQREIVEAVIQEAAQVSSITRAGDMLDAVGKSVRTDLSLNDMWSVQSNYKEARHSIEQLALTGPSQRIDGLSYVIISEEDRLAASNELREHLELEGASTATAE